METQEVAGEPRTADILNGRELSRSIEGEVKGRAAALAARGRPPRLVVLLVGDDPASNVYVGQKAKASARVGIDAETRNRPGDLSQVDLVREVRGLNEDPSVDGILIQLPLPSHIDPDVVLAEIDPTKDVDGFHPVNMGRLAAGATGLAPCTPLGILELLVRNGHAPRGKHVVIVGRSRTVGVPLSLLLVRKGEGGDATVTVCHSRTTDLADHCRRADILVAAVGSPRLITADMVKPGAVVVDVGINRVDDPTAKRGYRLVGDVDFDGVVSVAGAITPVPGGVGPLTVALLLRNTLESSERRQAE